MNLAIMTAVKRRFKPLPHDVIKLFCENSLRHRENNRIRSWNGGLEKVSFRHIFIALNDPEK